VYKRQRKGVSIFDGKKFRNIGFKISGKSKKHEQHVRCLYISKQNELYAGTFNGLFKFNSKLNCFVRISNYNKLIRKINSDSFGNIFYSTKEGLFVVKKGLHFKVNISFKGEKQDITIIKQIKGNLYWAGTANGFLKLNYKNGIFQVLSKHGNDFINDIIKLKNGNFLFVGNMGIIYIISKNGLSKFNLSEIIFYVNIKSVAEDYQGNCWFATSLGLIKMFPSEVKKSDYTDKIKSAATSFVKGENNVIYFGTPNGLIKADGNRIEKFQLTNIPTDNFISATNYQNNQLLVGTITNKVFKFKNGRFELIFESQQQPTCIYKIINPTVNEYWIAASNDIVHLKNGKKQIYHISDQYLSLIHI
jgi:ligand-binding sensor domain-containing protein